MVPQVAEVDGEGGFEGLLSLKEQGTWKPADQSGSQA